MGGCAISKSMPISGTLTWQTCTWTQGSRWVEARVFGALPMGVRSLLVFGWRWWYGGGRAGQGRVRTGGPDWRASRVDGWRHDPKQSLSERSAVRHVSMYTERSK